MPDPIVENAIVLPTDLDAELKGHYQSKGWDKLTPTAFALEAGKAHREAEKFLGIPAANLARIPTDPADEAGWKGLYERLGAPKDTKDYKFDEVKFADGTPIDQPTVDFIRVIAAKNHLAPKAAVELAKDFVKLVADDQAADAVINQAALQQEKAKLSADWGPQNIERNMIIAKAAAMRLGSEFAPALDVLQGQVGYASVMQAMYKLGTMTGEDNFLTNLNPGGPMILTKEQAVSKKAELMRDVAWTRRYFEGDHEAVKEFNALVAIEIG